MQNGSNEILRWDLPSNFRWLGVIDSALQEVGQELDWEPEEVNQISIACIEAVSNAIEHGNEFEVSRRVQVELRANGGSLVFIVTDEGGGFEESRLERNAPEPGDAQFLQSRGRGIHIMKSLMDQVRIGWNQSRRFTVELEKAVKTARESQD